MNFSAFNRDCGFQDAMVRTFRSNLLTPTQCSNLTQCENLEDIKVQLAATDYAGVLTKISGPLTTSALRDAMSDKLVSDFTLIRHNAADCVTLDKFLDFISHAYMIDNVVLLLSAALHKRDHNELLQRCHPLGFFDSLPALCLAETPQELYSLVLVDSPLAPYFLRCLENDKHLLGDSLAESPASLEILRNLLHRCQIEAFYNYSVNELGGLTGEYMKDILELEADRRTINIAINSLNTELSRDDRARLFPAIGKLYPLATERLCKADDLDAVRVIVERVPEYATLFLGTDQNAENAENGGNPGGSGSAGNDVTLDEKFYQREVELNRRSFMSQFHYAVFYSFLRLKEQEIRNIVWISECVAQRQRSRINNYVEIE